MSNKRKVRQTPLQATPDVGTDWSKRIIQIVAGVVVLGLVSIVLFTKPELRGVPDGTQTVGITTSEHVNGTIYASNEVPAGGAMDSIWQNCGFYDTQVRAENVVHSMEHGAVWVTYDASLAVSEISQLRGLVNRVEKVLVSPVPGQDGPIIVSAWGRQLQVDDSSDARLSQFINEFAGGATAPERGGRCNGGVGQPQF